MLAKSSLTVSICDISILYLYLLKRIGQVMSDLDGLIMLSFGCGRMR